MVTRYVFNKRFGHKVEVLVECLNSSWFTVLSTGPQTMKMLGAWGGAFLRWIIPVSWIANSASAQITAVLYCPYSLKRKCMDSIQSYHIKNVFTKIHYKNLIIIIFLILFFTVQTHDVLPRSSVFWWGSKLYNCTWMQHFGLWTVFFMLVW